MLAIHEYANDLILFALIVDCGSFSMAESAGITSSVVSKRIGRLKIARRPVDVPHHPQPDADRKRPGRPTSRPGRRARSRKRCTPSAKRAKSLTGTICMSAPTISGELPLSESVAEFL